MASATDGKEIVWGGMTQDALDAAYDQAAYAANMQQIFARWEANSDHIRARLGQPERHAYGPGSNEGLDVYRSHQPGAPIHLFVHGGAWRGREASDSAIAAETFVTAGACFVVIDFDWVQDRDGDLMPIAEQIRRAIAWTWRNAMKIGGDPNRLFVSGHSSGAHMVSVALTTDWPSIHQVPPDFIKGAVLCSGIYDLTPVSLSARSSYVTFTAESIDALSPMRRLDQITCPLIVAHGSLDTPEFQRQSRDFAAALLRQGHSCQTLLGEHYNHFELIETMANPLGLIGRAALAQMGLGAP